MNRFDAIDGDVRWCRVSRAQACRAWDAGQDVVLCPVKLFPFGGWRPSILANRTGWPDRAFDVMVRDFVSYNCTCHETGYYASFFVRVEQEITRCDFSGGKHERRV